MLVALLLCSLPLALGPVFLALASILPVLAALAGPVPATFAGLGSVADYGEFDTPAPLTRSERAARQPRGADGRFVRATAPVTASYLDRFGTVPSVK